jgi:hypothetical protein
MKTKQINLKTIALGLAMFAGTTTLLAQTDSTSKRILPGFGSIVINSSMDIKLTQGTETSVSVETGILDKKLITEVKDNVLYIKGRSGDDLVITFTKLNKLELLSMCDVKSTNQIISDKLEVNLKGAASDIDLDVNVKELVTTIEGAGDIKYKGTADSHSIVVKGAGDVNAYGLETKTTNVEIDGAGDAKLNATQNLTGTINGAGDITYLTEPTVKDIKVNGVGSYGLKSAGKTDASDVMDTTRFNIGNKKVLIVGEENDSTKHKSHKNKFNIYWAGLGLGVNGYMNINNETKTPVGYDFLDLDYGKSLNVSINFWEQKIPIWKRHINLVTGMGWDISNYRFTNDHYKLISDSIPISAVYDSSVTFKKNKLTASYLNVPLLLQFDTNPFGKHNKTVHVSAGIVGSYRIGSHTKQVYEVDGVEFKPKTRDNFNLNTWRYSAMVRLGVGKIDIYASYAMNGLFKKDQGPQVYPFTVGITLASF